MNLPNVPEEYTPTVESDRNRILAAADLLNRKIGLDVDLAGSDAAAIRKPRIIIASPNGTRFSIVVSDTGAVSAEALDLTVPPWATFAPTITPSAGVWTPTSVDCGFQQTGKSVFFKCTSFGSLSVPCGHITVSLPVPAIGGAQHFSGGVNNNAATFAAYAVAFSSQVDIYKFDTSGLLAGAGFISVSGVYEAA